MVEPTGAGIAVQLRPTGPRGFSTVLSFHGEHGLRTTPDMHRTLSAIEGNVLVDLSQCTAIDSTVIEVLIGTSTELERAGHFLEIVAPPANTAIARTLEAARIRDLIVVHPARPRL